MLLPSDVCLLRAWVAFEYIVFFYALDALIFVALERTFSLLLLLLCVTLNWMPSEMPLLYAYVALICCFELFIAYDEKLLRLRSWF